LKQQPGKDMHIVGGTTLVSSLMNLGLIDELQLLVNPVILDGGSAIQGREGATCFETRPGETLAIGEGQSDFQHAIVNDVTQTPGAVK
jgi:dihydrofolate reductase